MINFNKNPEENIYPTNKKSKIMRKILTYSSVVVIIIFIFAGKVIMSSPNNDAWFGSKLILNNITKIASTPKLVGENNDRINILLIGMGGKNHDGGYLADTIILLSIKPSTKQMSMISIPRDLSVPINDGYFKKVNSINAVAEQKEAGSGGKAMTKALSSLLNTPIHYYLRVDFDGFINIIDELGGVDVNVSNTLDDYMYPIMGEEENENYYARFEHLHVEKGLQTMDGKLALKFARSRHGVGLEGSDFARAKRQQLIIQGVKDKLLTSRNLLKPTMIVKILNQLNEHVDTNIEIRDLLSLWDSYQDIDKNNIINRVIDNSPEGLLFDARGEDGAYLLLPKNNNYDAIKDLATEIFEENTPIIPESPLENSVSLQIVNGTWITGLAANISQQVQAYNYNVTKISNGVDRDLIKSYVYDLSYGKNDEAIKKLINLTGASLAFDSPDWLEYIKRSSSTPDLVIILGTDADKLDI